MRRVAGIAPHESAEREKKPTEKAIPALEDGDREGVVSVNILETKEDGLYLNGVRLDYVTRLDVNNISPDGEMEAVIHIDIHEANIKYKVT